MEQCSNLNSVMESETILKNGASSKSLTNSGVETKMTIFSLSKIIAIFALFFICGCSKDNDNVSIDDSQPVKIEEIVYCQPDLNDPNLQPRFIIKT